MSLAISRARATDPLTSYNAAQRSVKFANGHASRILQYLDRFDDGTAKDIGNWCDLTVVQVDRRMVELQRAGQARVVQQDGEDVVRNGMRVWTAV